MVLSCWPVIDNIPYGSPPKYRSYGPDEDEDLEPEQRTAKRRRIEQNVNDYLKGKELYISSAVLKGTFASDQTNPWRRALSQIGAPNSEDGKEAVETEYGSKQSAHLGLGRDRGDRQILRRRTDNAHSLERPVVNTWENTRLERPSSRASVGYCAEWLQRRKTRTQTPTIDSDDEIDRPRRRTSFAITKSPTQHALNMRRARNSSPAKYVKTRKDRSSPQCPQSPSIEITAVEHDYSVGCRLLESMDPTAGSNTLQHLASPEDRTAGKRFMQHRIDMPPSLTRGFTAINSPSKDGGTNKPDSARRDEEHQLPNKDAHKSRHESLRSTEKIARRTVSLGAKGPLAAVRYSRHLCIASPAVANGSPGFPYRRISGNGSKARVSVPVSGEIVAQTINHSRVEQSRVKGSGFDSSIIGNLRHEQKRGLLDHSHAAERRAEPNKANQGMTLKSNDPDSVVRDDEAVYDGAVYDGTSEDTSEDESIDDMEFDDAAPDAPKEMPVNHASSRSGSENANSAEVRIVAPSDEDVRRNGIMAKWRCPVAACTRDFNTRGGLASHITRGHKLQVAKEQASGNPKRQAKSNGVKPAGRVPKRGKEQEQDVEVTGSIYYPTLKKAPKAKQSVHRSATAIPPEPSTVSLPEFPTFSQFRDPSPAPQLSEPTPASAIPPLSFAPQLPELHIGMSDASDRADITPLTEIDNAISLKRRFDVGKIIPRANPDDLAHDDDGRTDANDVVAEDNIAGPSSPLGQQDEGNGEKSARSSASTKERANSGVSGTTIPDHQDSGAYSSFTFRPEQSTQAALLQAQLAFQETEVDDQHSQDGEIDAVTLLGEKLPLEAVSKSIYPLGAVTPFRELNKRFSVPAAPTLVFPVMPAATQDLEAAAASVMFSTVKKPRTGKRISFANWPATKPCKDPVAKGSTKGVEWSPFASETPAPKTCYVTPSFAMNGGDESEVGRIESLPTEQGYGEITLLEASSSRIFMITPKGNSFAAPTPHHHMESFSARTVSFSPRPMALSSGSSSKSQGAKSLSGPSDVPVPSFQEGQGGLLAELNSQDVEEILDDTNHLLGSWDPEQVDKSSFVGPAFTAA